MAMPVPDECPITFIGLIAYYFSLLPYDPTISWVPRGQELFSDILEGLDHPSLREIGQRLRVMQIYLKEGNYTMLRITYRDLLPKHLPPQFAKDIATFRRIHPRIVGAIDTFCHTHPDIIVNLAMFLDIPKRPDAINHIPFPNIPMYHVPL